MSSSANRVEIVGRRDPETGRASLVVRGDGREWPLPVTGHEPGRGEWGFGSSTVHHTARAMLEELTGSGHPPAVVAAFEAEVVAQLPHEGFSLHDGDVAAWLKRRSAS